MLLKGLVCYNMACYYSYFFRIELLLNNLNDFLSYNDILELVNSVLSSFHERVDVIGSEYKGKICKNSLIGVFMKKFCLAFQALSMEKIIAFIHGFRQLAEFHEIVSHRVEK